MKPLFQHTSVSIIILIAIFTILTACTNSEPAQIGQLPITTPTLVIQFTATLSPTLTPTNTPTPTNTLTPTNTPQPTSTQRPTRTPTPTATITPSPSPIPPLTIRQPSIEDIQTYLTAISSEEIPFYRPFSSAVEFIYEDVNGDGEDDLIISDFLLVSVFIWEGIQYGKPLLYQIFPFKYDPGSRVYLEDWTNDGVPEIIFDYRGDTGGTGVRYTDWTKYVIHCPPIEKTTCDIVWAGELTAFTEDYNAGGLDLFQADVEHIIQDDIVSLVVTTHAFALYSWGWYLVPPPGDSLLFVSQGGVAEGLPDDYQIDGINVFTSTLTTFTWNGNFFERQNREIIESGYVIDSQANLEATNSNGHIAKIEVESPDIPFNQNDLCQLIVDNILIATQFGCKRDFTVVNWQDITNDGNEELTITALSGLYAPEPVSEPLSEKGCAHQRFIAYQWIGSQIIEIANITGCVVQSDLYGISVQDIEGDGQVEILAANGWFTGEKCGSIFSGGDGEQYNCWYEFGYREEVYKWNGSEFVYWGLLPE